MRNLIYLIGMMGVGKTTVAPLIAKELGYSWTDTDIEVEKTSKQSSREIVDQIGVDGFRILETKVLINLANHSEEVIACGGGIILREENYPYLRQNNNIVIWLNLPIAEIHRRMLTEPRSNLRGLNSQELQVKLEEIYQLRYPLYKNLSDICVQIFPKQKPEEVCNKVLDAIEKSKLKTILI